MLFVAIAGNRVGFGHLNRCLSLAECASHSGFLVSFLLFGDNEAREKVENAGFTCQLESFASLEYRSIHSFIGRIERPDALVADISYLTLFRSMDDVKGIFDLFHGFAGKTVMIDSMGEQALASRVPDLAVDMLVVPYVGAKESGTKSWLSLAGADYAVLAPPYQHLPERSVRKNSDRILVSCGGGDPTALTPIVLEGLNGVLKVLEIRVIVGPLFAPPLKATLKELASSSLHTIHLVDSPQCLVGDMQWCDLAVATSGLIKYELAATSTPAVLISIDDIHHAINQPFAASGAIVDLGTYVSSGLIACQVTELLNNYEARKNMACAGRRLIDGNGANRVINEITRSFHATE